jgi:hypothetical protein
MKFNNLHKLVLSMLSVLASAFLLYWATAFWIFNNLNLREGQSILNSASIISTIVVILIAIAAIV